MINFREGWRGHLWQGRFSSYPMGERYLLTAARYIEFNPVKAGLASVPEAYPWSSASAHLSGRDDGIVRVDPLLNMAGDWRAFLSEGVELVESEAIERHERTGRPLGNKSFIATLESKLGRRLERRKPGPSRISIDN